MWIALYTCIFRNNEIENTFCRRTSRVWNSIKRSSRSIDFCFPLSFSFAILVHISTSNLLTIWILTGPPFCRFFAYFSGWSTQSSWFWSLQSYSLSWTFQPEAIFAQMTFLSLSSDLPIISLLLFHSIWHIEWSGSGEIKKRNCCRISQALSETIQ